MRKVSFLACLVVALFCGCSSDDENESKYGHTQMDIPVIDRYMGGYDAQCVNNNGTGYLSFYDNEDADQYYCLETCQDAGQEKSKCYYSTSLGGIEVTNIYTCKEVDGKQVFAPKARFKCNHACSDDKTSCD